MAKTLHLDIVTPEKPTASLEVEEVSLPAAEGEMGVLPGHMPYVTALKPGELRYHKDGKVELLAISGGFAEVRGDSVLVLAETEEMAVEIDVKRAENKIREASQAIKAQSMEQVDVDKMRAELMMEIVRLRVGNKAGKR